MLPFSVVEYMPNFFYGSLLFYFGIEILLVVIPAPTLPHHPVTLYHSLLINQSVRDANSRQATGRAFFTISSMLERSERDSVRALSTF